MFPLLLTGMSFLVGSPRTEQKGQIDRTIGSFNQSNEFGRYLMLLVIMGVALYPHVERRFRLPLAMALGSSSCFLFLTYTRSALVGTAVGLLVVGILQNKRVIFGLLAVAAMALVVVPGTATRFAVLDQADARAGEGNSLAWRFEYWGKVLPLAEKNPLTGIGLAQTQYQTDEAKQPHNDFLRAYVETGVLGLAAYLGLMAALIGLGIRAVKKTVRGTFERGAAVGFMGAVAAFISVSTVANVISNVVVLWYFFAYAAVASALARGVTAHQPEARAP
jgi:putative inorganic carbon (hco3(-)) transporter